MVGVKLEGVQEGGGGEGEGRGRGGGGEGSSSFFKKNKTVITCNYIVFHEIGGYEFPCIFRQIKDNSRVSNISDNWKSLVTAT